MAVLCLNQQLVDLIDKVLAEDGIINESEVQMLSVERSSNQISSRGLSLLKRYLHGKGQQGQLRKLCEGTRITFSKFQIEETTKTPEYKQRRELLVKRQQIREYNKMVYGKDMNPELEEEVSIGNQYSSVKNQISISANMIVSVFIMFGIGYLAGKSISDDESTRMICGLSASILIMIIEMVLFILRAVRMENAFEREPPVNSIAKSENMHKPRFTSLTKEEMERQTAAFRDDDEVEGKKND